MGDDRRRSGSDRQAQARAMVRRRRRRRQRRILIGTCVIFLAMVILGIIFGIRSFRNNSARNVLREQGITTMQQGNYEQAITVFDQALQGSKGKIGKFEADVLSYRGEAEYRAGGFEAAKHTFTILAEKKGKTETYERMLCLCEMELGNYDAALAYGYANAQVYNKMAIRDIEAENYESALANIEKGLAEGDGAVIRDLLFNQAVVYEHMGDFKKALELLEAYVITYGADEETDREITFLKTRQGEVAETTTGE